MILKNLRIFVTGGAGFIGSHVVEKLSKVNNVTVFDNQTSSVVFLKKSGEIIYIEGDIRDLKKITKAMKHHDVVIAMAAAHLRVSMTNPLLVHDVNATGTLTTLLAAKANKVKRFVYISSSEVYGTAQGTGLMDETHATRPTTVYGVSKYVGELYTREFHDQEGVPGLIVRPFNTYGPRSHFDGYYGEVIPRMVIRALNGLPPLIFGDGSQSRDFTFVEDIAQGIIDAASCDKLLGDVVNVAFGHEVTIKRIVEIILDLTNPKLKPVYKDKRPNDVMRHAADTKKAQQILDWNPRVSIAEGIKRYIEWVKEMYPDVTSLLKKIPEKNW